MPPPEPGHCTCAPLTTATLPVSGVGVLAFQISAARQGSATAARRFANSTAWARVWAATATRRSARCASAAASRLTRRVLPAPGGEGTSTAGSPDHTENRVRASTGSRNSSEPGHAAVAPCRCALGAERAGAGCGVGVLSRAGVRIRIVMVLFGSVGLVWRGVQSSAAAISTSRGTSRRRGAGVCPVESQDRCA